MSTETPQFSFPLPPIDQDVIAASLHQFSQRADGFFEDVHREVAKDAPDFQWFSYMAMMMSEEDVNSELFARGRKHIDVMGALLRRQIMANQLGMRMAMRFEDDDFSAADIGGTGIVSRIAHAARRRLTANRHGHYLPILYYNDRTADRFMTVEIDEVRERVQSREDGVNDLVNGYFFMEDVDAEDRHAIGEAVLRMYGFLNDVAAHPL